MRKLVFTLMLAIVPFLMNANNTEPNDEYTTSGRQVKKVSYYDNGNIKEVGYYFKEKLDGQWLSYDENGKIKTIAYYKDGKKDGIWTFFKSDEVFTVEYLNNKIVNTVAIR